VAPAADINRYLSAARARAAAIQLHVTAAYDRRDSMGQTYGHHIVTSRLTTKSSQRQKEIKTEIII